MVSWLANNDEICGCSLPHILPLTTLGAIQHSVANLLRFQGVAEGGTDRLARGEAFQEVGDLMHEAVLVADRQTRHPPLVHVGVVAVGDVNAAPATQAPLIAVIEVLQAMEVVQIPLDRSMLPLS